MPINPNHFGTLSFVDYSNEPTSFQFYFGAITAGTLPGFLTQFGAFRTATEAITLGTLRSDQWVGDKTIYANAPPTDVNAQRERKFLVSYEGVTSHSKYEMEIGTADFTGRVIAGTDKIDLTETAMATWVTAFETLGRTQEGENVNVLEAFAVGRST